MAGSACGLPWCHVRVSPDCSATNRSSRNRHARSPTSIGSAPRADCASAHKPTNATTTINKEVFIMLLRKAEAPQCALGYLNRQPDALARQRAKIRLSLPRPHDRDFVAGDGVAVLKLESRNRLAGFVEQPDL